MEQGLYLSRLAIDYELDGVGCAATQVPAVRAAIGHGIIVCRAVRSPLPEETAHPTRLTQAANYVLIGRALIDSTDPDATLESYGYRRPRVTA